MEKENLDIIFIPVGIDILLKPKETHILKFPSSISLRINSIFDLLSFNN